MPGGPQPGRGCRFQPPSKGVPRRSGSWPGMGGVPPRPRDSCCWVPDPALAGLGGCWGRVGARGSLRTWLGRRLASGDTSEVCPLQMTSGARRFIPWRSDRAIPSSRRLCRGSRRSSSLTLPVTRFGCCKNRTEHSASVPASALGSREEHGGAGPGERPRSQVRGPTAGSLGHSEPPGHPPHCRASTEHPGKGH